MTRPTSSPAKSTVAIGRPLARLLVEAQKTVVTWSSRAKPSRRAPFAATVSISASSAPHRARRTSSRPTEVRSQMPAVIPLLNATYTTSRIEPRSQTSVSRRCRVTRSTSSGRANCPARKGSSSCTTMSVTCPREKGTAPLAPPRISSAASSGVRTTPRSVEKEAEQMAAATLPRAIEVRATEDCTVEGSRHRKRMPVAASALSTDAGSCRSASPSSGKRAKVHSRMGRCSRQWPSPPSAARGESRTP